ncbi:MAG: glycosyltransferase family 2 protein [Lachnospiraceae bacterium]|nr:glycosyltransferase family 2 protein [Lachnospiraceae bacterium]
MVTISLCMIVKNEEAVLRRCLDSLTDIADEIIIADTGSTDNTKNIALEYTCNVYDYKWTGDFAAARNFVASKATKEYIYTADADEYLDEENREKVKRLKSILLPEIEIVQMLYCTPPELSTVYNYEKEYRPKLYKRLREFTWIDPIHETLRIDPVVYDSEIEVQHRPVSNHAGRDLDAFASMFKEGRKLSKKLHHMYAMELFRSGTDKDFCNAAGTFMLTMEQDGRSMDEVKEAMCVLARYYRIKNDIAGFFGYALKDSITEPCAEICCELGMYYESTGDYKEASIWYQNALSEPESILDIRTSGEIPENGLERCIRQTGHVN